MIICKRPVHPDDHLQEAGPSGWSFAKGRSIRMIHYERPVHPDDHLQEAGPSIWSFAKGWSIRMIICKRSVHHQGVLEFLCHWLIVLLNFISTWVLMCSMTKFKEHSRGICYSVTHHDGVAHPLVSINRKLIKWQNWRGCPGQFLWQTNKQGGLIESDGKINSSIHSLTSTYIGGQGHGWWGDGQPRTLDQTFFHEQKKGGNINYFF